MLTVASGIFDAAVVVGASVVVVEGLAVVLVAGELSLDATVVCWSGIFSVWLSFGVVTMSFGASGCTFGSGDEVKGSSVLVLSGACEELGCSGASVTVVDSSCAGLVVGTSDCVKLNAASTG